MQLKSIIFSPPVVFFMFVAVIAVFSAVLSKYAVKGKKVSKRGLDAYACGQQGFKEYVNPDYTQFFTFAFIFTVMHVLTMVVATAPKDMSLMPILYILAGIFVLVIVFKKG